MAIITPERLRLFAPQCDFGVFAPALQRAADLKQINTPRRVAHWLGQLHEESRGLTRLVESLNYSAERLVEVWPRRFPTIASAKPYEHNPVALANKVYGGRFGNVGPNDGWKFRGRGLNQLTFHDNYVAATGWSGFDLVANPDQAAEPATACVIAAAYWDHKGLNDDADRDDVVAITEAINGGQNGLAERKTQVARAKLIFG